MDGERMMGLQPASPSALMLDGSLLLSPRTAFEIARALDEDELDRIAISGTLLDLIAGDESLEPVAKYFGPYSDPERSTESSELKFLLEAAVTPFSLPAELDHRSAQMRDSFLERTGDNELVTAILLEEWLFLHSNSWIASRTKRTFRTFITAGDAAIELGRRGFDHMARRTLKIPNAKFPEPLDRSQRLRATVKWLAAGGPPIAALVNPILAAGAGFAGAVFLLLDP